MNIQDRLAQLCELDAQFSDAITHVQTELKSSQEFRDAVEDLLKDTSYRKPTDGDTEGLYGRLRNALTARAALGSETSWRSQHSLYEITEAMTKYGGSFVVQLAQLFRLADDVNKKKLRDAFLNYLQQYDKYISHE